MMANDDKTTNKQDRAPGIEGVIENVAGFGENLTTLIELQTQLASLELSDFGRRVRRPVGFGLIAFSMLSAGLGAVLMGAGARLEAATPLEHGAGAIVIGAAASACALAALAIAALRLSSALASFERTRLELGRNFKWVRSVLASGGASASRKAS